MVSFVDNLLFLHQKRRFLSQTTPCVPHCENKKSLLSHWLPATQILRLSNLIYILLFKLLSIIHLHSWYSDLSLRLWSLWSLNVLTISFVFLCVHGPAHYQCYFSVPTANSVCICKFNPQQHTSIIRSSKHRRQILSNSNCFLLLLWKISDQTISLDYYHPRSATNSARSFTFQPVSFGQWNVVS